MCVCVCKFKTLCQITGMGRKASTPMRFDVNCNESRDVLLTPDRFALRKDQLLPELRARADAPPRQMHPGTGQRANWWTNLAQRREERNGTLVRGFCLYEMAPLSTKRARAPAWRCCFHMVVATRTPSDHVVYVDPNESRRRADEDVPYIFVPSSRAYASFTDAELLSDQWLVGSVLLGDARVCNAVLAYEQTRGRTRSVVATTPEALVAKPRVVVRMPHHFVEWHRARALANDAAAQAEAMGAAVFACGEADQADAIASYAAVTENTEACVDAVRGLKLELQCSEKLLRGELSVEEARQLFFAHFDRTLQEVRDVQARRLAAWREEWASD